MLRKFTFYMLLGGMPLLLYMITWTGFSLIPGLFLDIRISSIVAPILCCLFWALVIFHIDTSPTKKMDQTTAARALQTNVRKERLAALRYIYRHHLEISRFSGHQQLAATTDFAQRYWLLKNYGNSRSPAAWQYINMSLNSDSAYLVCKAIEAARNTNTVEPDQVERLLVQKLASSSNWYIQFYAYRFLKERGWIPKLSN